MYPYVLIMLPVTAAVYLALCAPVTFKDVTIALLLTAGAALAAGYLRNGDHANVAPPAPALAAHDDDEVTP